MTNKLAIEPIRAALQCDNPSCACHKPNGHVHCPAHADDHPSLSVSEGDGKVLWYCHAGCSQDQVESALKEKGVWPSRSGGRPTFKVAKTYDYHDSAGKLVYQVCRLDPKDFRQRRPDPQNLEKWLWNLKSVKRLPYRLPELLKAETVYIVEGEKDADALTDLGLTATTNPQGAGKWRAEYNSYFQDKKVTILPDNDQAGRDHAQDVAQNLHGVASSVKVVKLPGLPEKGDASDWLTGGGTLEELSELDDASEEWTQKALAPDPAVTITAPDKTYLPVPPPFPLEILPPAAQRAITEIQRAHGVPVEVPACAFLGTAGGCIGRARGVCIKQGWVEHGNLWLGIVAPSGYGKSPAVREIQRSIFTLEKTWFAEYQEALEQYTLELEQRRLTPKDERSSLPPPPTPPGWRQLIVDDTTTEALTDTLTTNPRGILWNRDELAGLLYDLDKYAKKEGGTKARMMSSYDSGPWKVNRREASKRAFIPHATLSIFGTIQPKALPTIFSDLDAATGFLPRFIFVSPTRETPPLWTDETVSTKTRDYLATIFERLMALDFDGQGEPIIINIDHEAKRIYEIWFNEQVLEPWQDLEASIYEAVLAKLRGQCLRFALILHCLEAADAGRSDTDPVSLETMEKAITLANCLKAHQRNAWQSIVNQDQVAELPPLHRQVVRAILSLEGEIVRGMLATARITEQVNQGRDPRFHVSPDAVGKTAAVLSLTTDKLPDRSGRGFRIKPEDLQRLNSFFSSKICIPSVPSVPSDHNPLTMGLSGEKTSVPEVSQVTGGEGVFGHLGHLPDTCKIPGEAHEQSISDTSDTSDTSFNTGEEPLNGGVL